MDEAASLDPEMFSFASLEEFQEALAPSLRQDSPPQPPPSESVTQEDGHQMHHLLVSPKPQSDARLTAYIDPSILQRSGTKSHQQDPSPLREIGGTQMPVSRSHRRWPLSSLPASDRPWPAVQQIGKSSLLTPSVLRSANSLRRHLIHSPVHLQARYRRQSPMSVSTYADVEDLALDPQERPVHAPIAPHSEVEALALSPVAISSRSQNSVNIPQGAKAQRYHLNTGPCECHELSSSAPANTDGAEREEQLPGPVYKSRGRKRKEPLKGPIRIELVGKEKGRKRLKPSGNHILADTHRDAQRRW